MMTWGNIGTGHGPGDSRHSSSAMVTLSAASRLVRPWRTLSSALSKSIFIPSSRAALRSWSSGVRFWMRLVRRGVIRMTSKTPTRPR